jgi:hypothetical protein
MPSWNSATATVTGSGNDTDGASAWVQPNVALSTLTLTFKKLVGFPTYQLWFAGDTAPDQNYKITLAARSCPTYQAIMANKARNNIMQSLQYLGTNSLYSQSSYAGAVRPAVEDLPDTGQSVCTPLTGWKFGISNGTNGADTGTYGSLSKVRTPLTATTTTLATTSELDELGNNTGRTITGAITYNLTPAQIANITTRSLWVQGGIPGSPLAGRSDLAFGTLRCAIDNANGDNIEWVGMPTGTRHAFCYAYYVGATEQSGKIIIRKTVPLGGNGTNFGFGGDLSFATGGKFSLAAGASQTFIRAAGQDWNVSEDLPIAPFELTGLSCTSQNSTSTSSTDLASRSATVTLGANDTVTCTFTNEAKPKVKLTLYKIANGATGTFGFTINKGLTSNFSGDVTVNQTGTETLVDSESGLTPGDYTITETSLPTVTGGTWDTPTISCVDSTGNAVAASNSANLGTTGATITLNGVNTECTVVNTFIPNAKIHVVSKITGGTGATTTDSSYVISNADFRSSDNRDLRNTAWDNAGAQTSDLTGQDFGDYNITAIPPTNTDTATWSLDSLLCDGGASYTVTDSNVDLTLDNSADNASEITCTYTWKLTSLANVYLEKISQGDVGTFNLTASYDDSADGADVTTTSTGVAVQALSILGVAEGTPITIGESSSPTTPDGQWNIDNNGDPAWSCLDTAQNVIPVNGASQITSTNLDITCTATNTFTADASPSPSPSSTTSDTSPSPDSTYDPVIAYSKGGTLPHSGGNIPSRSWWSQLVQTASNLFN